jgi:glucose/mannose-6-phosphate isomerase
MMSDAIKNFPKQFKYNPKIENQGKLKRKKKVVILGMGGSHLAADLVVGLNPKYDIKVHSDYGLPNMDEKELQKSLVIASSYSGNTEEVIDGLEKAIKQNLNVAVVATGGKLIAIAKAKELPYIELPNDGIQPRSALGYSLRGLLKLIGLREEFKQAGSLKKILQPKELEQAGKELAEKLKGSVPVIYTSNRNKAVAYNWKIKLNETGKIPAFYNVLPELNHNEMTGMDVKDTTRDLSQKFYFIFLRDSEDDERNIKRMEILQKLYQERGLRVEVLEIAGEIRWQKIFSSLLLADWTAFYIAAQYGLEAEQVPMVEEFKKMIVD